jgi:cytochrome c oxidase subunit IV
MVDYLHLQGALRWTLILLIMFLKAGFIVAIFMHMKWERLALKLVILVPPLCLLVLITLMAIEGDYTFLTRDTAFTQEKAPAGHGAPHGASDQLPVTSE